MQATSKSPQNIPEHSVETDTEDGEEKILNRCQLV